MFLCAALVPPLCTGQAVTGTPNFSSFDSHPYDTVDLMSNTIVFQVPIYHKAGALPLELSVSANSGMTTNVPGTGPLYWTPMMDNYWSYASFPGQPFVRNYNGLGLESGAYGISSSTINSNCGGVSDAKYEGWAVVTGNGTVHPLGSTVYLDSATAAGCVTSFTATTVDGSGWTLSEKIVGNAPVLVSLYHESGMHVINAGGGLYQLIDRNGNVVQAAVGSSSTTITDSMGQTAVTYTNPTLHGTSEYGAFMWTDISQGVTTPTVTQNYYLGTPEYIATAFGCGSGHPQDVTPSQVIPAALISSFVFADGTSLQFAYEQTPGQSNKYSTGRVSKLTFPQGGSATYTYGGLNQGLNCTYGTIPTLTRKLDNGDTTTYSLAYSQIGTSGNYRAVNTVTDPGGNVSTYNFTGFTSTGVSPTYAPVLTQVVKRQGSSTVLETDKYCYNQSFSGCSNSLGTLQDTNVTFPITSKIVFSQISGNSNWRASEVHYDSYGNVTYTASYNYGAVTPQVESMITYGTWNGAGPCVGLTNASVKNTPCEVIGKVTGYVMSDARYTYDGNGNLLKSSFQQDTANAGSWVGQTVSNAYNPNGTISKSYDMNNNETDYTYSAAGYSQCTGCTAYPFPTQIKNVGTGNYVNYTYYGQGGAVATISDRNGGASTTTYSYSDRSGHNDPYWRPLQITNPLGAITDNGYPEGSPATTSSSWMNVGFNGGNSITGAATVTDSYGRLADIQTPQQPGNANQIVYDTLSSAYSWNGNYRHIAKNTVPCNATLAVLCSTPFTADIDPLGRVHQTSHGGAYETVTHNYNGVDDLVQVTPPSPGENMKQQVYEYDGLGRLTISCRIGAGFGNSCGTQTGSYQGVYDTYQYNQVHPQNGPNQTYIYRKRVDGSNTQSEYHAYDGLGRLVDIQPSFGPLVGWSYDAQTGNCPGSVASIGNVICYSDNVNHVIFLYDSQNRVTDVGGSTYCKRFRYDNTSGVLGSVPSGITLANQYGRLAEAETDTCAWPITQSSIITDEWFAYDAAGNVTDVWQMSPHSTQYYHSHAAFFENGAPKTIQLASPSFYTMAFGLDGEGRLYSVADTTHSKTIVNSATYFPGANPAVNTIYGSDTDSFTYDSTSGNVTQYQYTVNGVNYSGGLTWNPNGTLRKLATSDGFNAAGTQTCYFNPNDATSTGYNDFGQLVGFDCGGTNWGQTFSYDAFENITKGVINGRTGTSWNPGYNPSNNHYNVGTYDANGDVTSDGNFNYGWNEYGKLKWASSSGTPTCGASGRCITYDAFDRIVETSNGATWTERWYTQAGWVSMSGATINFAYWPLPHGGQFYEGLNGNAYYVMHPDWVGSTRLISNAAHQVNGDLQFSPYGEVTFKAGGPAPGQFNFAGMTENFYKDVMFDADNREYSIVPSRWLSPDPAHAGWNPYAYTTNPNSFVDPSGLDSGPPPCNGLDTQQGGQGCEMSQAYTSWLYWYYNWCNYCSGPPNTQDAAIATSGSGFDFSLDLDFGVNFGTPGGGSPGCGSDFNPCGLPPLGPSPANILQQVLSGNLAGALQTAGATPQNPGCEFGPCLSQLPPSGFIATGLPPWNSKDVASLSSYNDLMALLLGINISNSGPPRLRYNDYGVIGTTCSRGCHPEQFRPGNSHELLCQSATMLGVGVGTAAGPWVEGPLAWAAYGANEALGVYGLAECF